MDLSKKLEMTLQKQKDIIAKIQNLDELYQKERSSLMQGAIELEGQIKLLKEMEQ